MFEDIWYANKKIDKQEQGQKYPWRVSHEVFLNAKSQKQGKTKAYGWKNMEDKSQVHVWSISGDCCNHQDKEVLP